MVLEEREEEDSCEGGEVITIELLEEYWFFHNMLNSNSTGGILQRPPPLGSSSSSSSSSSSPWLPLPPPRMGMEKFPAQVEEAYRLPKPLLLYKKLQHSYSSVEKRAISIPTFEIQRSVSIPACEIQYQSSSKSTSQETTPPMHRPGKNHHTTTTTSAKKEKSRRALQVKKWKSLSDLEDKEVQGFKDLGFVFDRVDVLLSPAVVNMIPGLGRRDKRPAAEEVNRPVRRRPYLSEAWIAQKRSSAPPPPILHWVDPRSAAAAADMMKEQLKFWARAVASNVRQEC